MPATFNSGPSANADLQTFPCKSMHCSMFHIPLLAAAAAIAQVSAVDLWERAFKIPQDVYYLALHPSGADFCDNELARKQAVLFDARYGRRFNKLIEAVRISGPSEWPAGDVQLASCLRIDEKGARRLLDSFDRDLRTAEAKYGVTEDVR